MEIYHYRSIKRALQEIENCTFYFATSEEVNDPIEGYVRIFWQGDKYAWEGLLRNYISDLAITLFLLMYDANTLCALYESMAIDMTKNSTVPSEKAIKEDIEDTFLADEEIQDLTTFCGRPSYKFCEKYLRIILYLINNKALKLCISKYSEMRIISKENADKAIRILTRGSPIKLPFKKLNETPADVKLINIFAKLGIDFLDDLIELHYIQNSVAFQDEQLKNLVTMLVDFPKFYVGQLTKMMYPSNFVVCFSLNNNNSAMWGNYADCHKGVCLVYDVNENEAIKLEREHKECYFLGKSVSYGGSLVERNFFESLGGLSIPEIKKWLTGADGSISSSFEAYKDEETWRTEYWRIGEIKTHSKLKEWESEKEYRIILNNMFDDFSAKDENTRKLKYDAKCLRGVIFGIRTSEYDKKQIVEKLLKHKAEYDNFTFYQAEFDDEKQAITIRPKIGWESLMA